RLRNRNMGCCPMSASGQERTSPAYLAMSALPLKADMRELAIRRMGVRPRRALGLVGAPSSAMIRPQDRCKVSFRRSIAETLARCIGGRDMRNIAPMGSLHSVTGLTFVLTVAYLLLLFSGSATSQGGGEVPGARFEFALIGDMPYDARQEKEFANIMRDIDAAELAFVVHDGDFWYDGGAWTEQLGGFPPCG